MRKVALIYNSQNNNKKIIKIKAQIEIYFSQNSYELITIETSKEQRCNQIVNKTEADMLIICGGDGTMNELVNARHHNKNILYIPTGTVNDFAHSLNLNTNIDQLLKLVEKNQYLYIDTGKVNGQYFNYVLATGPMVDISFKTPSSLKKKLGRFAYVLYALINVKEIFRHFQIELFEENNSRIIECDYIFITNSNSVASFHNVYRDINLTDGKFECLIVKRTNKLLQVYLCIKAILFGIEKINSKHLLKMKVDKLKINTDDNIQWIIDGEKGPMGNINMEVAKQNLKIYTKREEKNE